MAGQAGFEPAYAVSNYGILSVGLEGRPDTAPGMPMKVCSKCKKEKAPYEFYKRSKRTGTNSLCKECFNSYCIDRWIKRKLRVVQQFNNRCEDCKNSFHYSIYEFHHLNPEQKDHSWNTMRLMSEEKMQSELSKCVMLCANCHRLRHHLIRASEKTP